MNNEKEAVSNELIINVRPDEIVIALLEDRRLVELNREKNNTKFSVGDIYLGKVKKLMTGLNAAFVDVGYERDAFLHYHDLGPQFQSLNRFLNVALAGNLDMEKARDLPNLPDINKNGKINEVLKSGQLVLVQVAKEPISTKGPRICSEISIAGRNLVLMPFSNKVSISQKIKSKEERDRLKKLIQSIKPKGYGVIVRTVAKNRRVAVLDAELKGLVDKWESAFTNFENSTPPKLVIGELSRTSAILRDVLNSSFSSIFVDDDSMFREIKNYITQIAPEKQKIVKHYTGKASIFDHYGVNKQIKALFGKTITIKNGAYLIIEHTEALHVIDVNSGNRSKKDTSQENNALEVNLAAGEEIARQLRLRDMGGIIVVDFIDMHTAENRHKLFAMMKEYMNTDRTKHNILPLSKFGLMQITRQRVRPEMNIETTETCPTCKGTGDISPSILIEDEIEGKMPMMLERSGKGPLTIYTHPYVAAYLNKGLLAKVWKWRLQYKRWIKVQPNFSYDLLKVTFKEPKKELKKEQIQASIKQIELSEEED